MRKLGTVKMFCVSFSAVTITLVTNRDRRNFHNFFINPVAEDIILRKIFAFERSGTAV